MTASGDALTYLRLAFVFLASSCMPPLLLLARFSAQLAITMTSFETKRPRPSFVSEEGRICEERSRASGPCRLSHQTERIPLFESCARHRRRPLLCLEPLPLPISFSASFPQDSAFVSQSSFAMLWRFESKFYCSLLPFFC